MKPIHRLSLKHKIKILHSLFPGEIPLYMNYLKACAVETMDDREEIARVWGNNVIQHGYWTFLADRTFDRIRKYGDSFNHCGKLFAKRLFKDRVCLFTLHTLMQYIEIDDCSPKFALAVKLLIEL